MRLPFKGVYKFTQAFGANPQNYSQFGLKGHDGLDFGCPTRTEIIAPHNGEVIEANFDAPGYGWYVKLESDKEGSVIAHLDAIDVQVGYKLNEGDHIGWSDNTGNSSGPHCHWGYYLLPRDRTNGYAGFIDQEPILANDGIHLTLGQLPQIDVTSVPVEAQAEVAASTMYKGLNLTNTESVKAAIDAWYDVANGKYKTAQEYQALKTQLEEVKKQLQDTQTDDEKVSSQLKNYNELVAMGYNTIDDVTNALAAKDTIIASLSKENTNIKYRSSVLAGEIQKMEFEDGTTAELGQKALDENKTLKESLIEIGKTVGAVKFDQASIMNQVFYLQDLANRFLKIMTIQEKARQKAVVVEKVLIGPMSTITAKVLTFLHMKGGEST